MRTDQLRVDMVHQHQLHLVLVDTFLFVDTQTHDTDHINSSTLMVSRHTNASQRSQVQCSTNPLQVGGLEFNIHFQPTRLPTLSRAGKPLSTM